MRGPISAVPILLGLASALTWGGADFAGGLATRRAAPGKVIFVAHGVSLAVLCLLLIIFSHSPAMLGAPMSAPMLLLGLASGVSGALGLMLFYKALSIGAMGLSAALAGLLTAALPVALAIIEQGRPGPWQTAGFAVAAAAIALIALSPNDPPTGERNQLRTLSMATLAGGGFGVQLVVLHLASSHGAVLPALALSRLGGTATGATAMLLAMTRARRNHASSASLTPLKPEKAHPGAQAGAQGRSAFLLLAVATGLLDTAGNGLYMGAALVGRLDVAAVLASLYPGATILLAAWLLQERTSRLQTLGMILALVAVALISA